ncbi:hypothetical protein U9M48_022939 [Paspalum notatum var. saurae]|uniref:Uncharacterized protein n=1 Tax=Paspalum notatum var. saurae TaxID=547442 RepID=A0AAQ3WU53_PASNO
MLHQLVPLPRSISAKTLLSPFPAFVPPPRRPPPSLRPPCLHICTCTSAAATGENAASAVSGMTARERRLVKVREERRRREHDREHTYPGWAKVLENACRDDEELRTILGDSIGNPELMKHRIQERVRKKGRAQFNKSKTGSIVAFKVSFRDFNPLNSFIWLELYGEPTDRDVDLLGGVIQAWYVMGRIGAYNSSNLQLANSMLDYDPSYDSEEASSVMPSSIHDISDVEFQDNWARVWHVGIKRVVFGGKRMGDWEEGMTSSDYGYKQFKI